MADVSGAADMLHSVVKMVHAFEGFLIDEGGAISIDWMLFSAAILAMCLAFVALVSSGSEAATQGAVAGPAVAEVDAGSDLHVRLDALLEASAPRD